MVEGLENQHTTLLVNPVEDASRGS
jgi:hypothetical protein